MPLRSTVVTSARTSMAALARDKRGNTLAIIAASLIPLAGMVGGGVDLSRMYIVKTRLQHACDAGALAGRKQMGGGAWAFNNNAANAAAQRFFDANIQASPYGASSVTRSFSESAGKVTGTASATLPMTLMRVLGKTTETISVTCDAEMRLPNTDVMFVLDTTGSMGSKAVSTDSQTKIQALRSAVKCFYEIVARLDTEENCTTGTPTGGTSASVQVRFGFMPYATNVNVGKLLPNDFLADNWNYQSRVASPTQRVWAWTVGAADTPSMTGSWSNAPSDLNNQSTYSGWTDFATSPANVTINGTSYAVRRSLSETNCNNLNVTGPSGNRMLTYTDTPGTPGSPYENGTATAPVYPATTQSVPYRQDRTNSVTGYKYQFYSGQSGSNRCRLQSGTRSYTVQRDGSASKTVTWQAIDQFTSWDYKQVSHNVSGLKAGAASWNSTVNVPIGLSSVTAKLSGSNSDTTVQTVANVSVSWDGCIEERATVSQSSYSPIPSGAKDLDIDLVPSTSDSTTQWGPALPRMVYARAVTTAWSQLNRANATTTTDYYNYVPYYCPQEAKKLQTWPTASAFQSYVNGLEPDGNTYHDIGLLWGARFLSPTGIFRSENEYTAQGGEIERHLIFMTDGEACTGDTDYAAYGFPWLDRRTTDPDQAPTGGCLTTGTITQQVNARTQAICSAVKNKNITLWVIWFGASSTTIEGMMQSCATPGRYFAARNATDLQNTFKSIADQISQLRLTR